MLPEDFSELLKVYRFQVISTEIGVFIRGSSGQLYDTKGRCAKGLDSAPFKVLHRTDNVEVVLRLIRKAASER